MNVTSYVVLLFTISCFSSALAQTPIACTPATCAYLNPELTPVARAKDLVSRMTLQEEVSQTMNAAPAIPRLGVPSYEWWSEALHGVARAGVATNFPQSIGLAATFDTGLMRQVADVIGTEGRAKYNEAQRAGDHRRFSGLTFWSPNINIFRDPRWGRGQETFGEDPFLTARMGVEFTRGLQGDDPKFLLLVATPKHYAVHSGPEQDRHHFNAQISDHDLEDTYLPAFRASIVEGRAASIMCAYNAIDGKPACASDMLLQKHLRDAWKFDGFVVSDCDSVADVYRGHHFASDDAHASAVSLKAGTDLDCGSAYRALALAVKSGLVSKAELDIAVERLFAGRFRLGMFDPPGSVPYDRLSASSIDTPANRELALRAARESLVLLKNDGILPIKNKDATIAAIGPTADLLEAIEGNYNGEAAEPVTPLLGLRREFGVDRVLYAPGSILAAGLPAPIPSQYLRPDEKSMRTGLKAEFFADGGFTGQPLATRIDAKVNFDWNRVSPASGVPPGNFAVRWTGELVPPIAGEYMLSFRCIKRSTTYDPTSATAHSPLHYRLYLDDKEVLDDHARYQDLKVVFNDTKPHAIRVEYMHSSEDRFVDLEWQPPAQPMLDEALATARKADVVVAFVGLSPNLEGEEMPVYTEGFAGGDRTMIGLPAVQQHLLEELGKLGKPLLVVLTSGSEVSIPWAQEHANAVLAAWYPGESGGTAIAETLTGKNNPAGRLPVTFYRSVTDLPEFSDYAMANRTYRYFQGPVLYPFGFGLSYSTFEYGKASVSQPAVRAGEVVKVSVNVRNTSPVAGDEVVQLYVTPPRTPESPRLALEGFQRVHLAAGESRDVTFPLDARALSEVDRNGDRHELPGEYTISVGGSQPAPGDLRAVHLQVTGELALPR
ncbi:beta-glucosidase [Granulicella rosea]|uniref:Beta-glucosidase n=1 Tax=Granulicella rosea TaxID=474952 RepID=A0A239M4N0_9BACT|nr:glycoside hydrolase family 3 C-terminal domain-containing protein [Granulicella rosea]SNT37807.1 beta-glucosidase [Granulicella rosea]